MPSRSAVETVESVSNHVLVYLTTQAHMSIENTAAALLDTNDEAYLAAVEKKRKSLHAAVDHVAKYRYFIADELPVDPDTPVPEIRRIFERTCIGGDRLRCMQCPLDPTGNAKDFATRNAYDHLVSRHYEALSSGERAIADKYIAAKKAGKHIGGIGLENSTDVVVKVCDAFVPAGRVLAGWVASLADLLMCCICWTMYRMLLLYRVLVLLKYSG